MLVIPADRGAGVVHMADELSLSGGWPLQKRVVGRMDIPFLTTAAGVFASKLTPLLNF